MTIGSERAALQLLFQSMLQQLMTGQVRVGTLDAVEVSADVA